MPGAGGRPAAPPPAACSFSISPLICETRRCFSASPASIWRFACARCGDHLHLPGMRHAKGRAARRHLAAESLHLAEHLRVLARDAIDRVEAVDQILEARRAEEELERRGRLAADVEVAQPAGEAILRDAEVRPRDLHLPPVHAELRLDLAELHVRGVVRLDGLLELRVERLDLLEHLPRLGLLRVDPRVGERGNGGKQSYTGYGNEEPCSGRATTRDSGSSSPHNRGRTGRGRYVTARHPSSVYGCLQPRTVPCGETKMLQNSHISSCFERHSDTFSASCSFAGRPLTPSVSSSRPSFFSPSPRPAPPDDPATLRAQGAELAAAERSAQLELFALERRLDTARGGARGRRGAAGRGRARASDLAATAACREADVVGVGAGGSRAQVRALYVEDQPDVLAVFLGASSIEEALDDVDNLQRTTDATNNVLEQAKAARRKVARLLRSLTARRSRAASASVGGRGAHQRARAGQASRVSVHRRPARRSRC